LKRARDANPQSAIRNPQLTTLVRPVHIVVTIPLSRRSVPLT
jgi:hypothetical protein